MISRKVANNAYSNYRQKARERFLGPNLCPQGGAADTSTARIDHHALMGPLTISCCCTLLGLGWYLLDLSHKNHRLSMLFREINKNDDHEIDDVELKDVLDAMGLLNGVGMGHVDDAVQSYREEIDANGDGLISFSEFKDWARSDDKLGHQLGRVLRTLRTTAVDNLCKKLESPESSDDVILDTGDVKLLLVEMGVLKNTDSDTKTKTTVSNMEVPLVRTRSQFDTIWEKIDNNGDGKISWRELKDWAEGQNLSKKLDQVIAKVKKDEPRNAPKQEIIL